jgi:hypothetical protein
MVIGSGQFDHQKERSMSISLSDIPAAVADYIQSSVTVEVSEVKHGISTVLQPHEKGTFNVTVTNNGVVRLTDLVYELSVKPGKVAKLIVPEASLVFGTLDGIDGDPLAHNSEVTTMFISPFIDEVSFATIDGGASATTPDFQVKTQGTLGDATITCILHATVDQASLFPAEQERSPSTRTLTVS